MARPTDLADAQPSDAEACERWFKLLNVACDLHPYSEAARIAYVIAEIRNELYVSAMQCDADRKRYMESTIEHDLAVIWKRRRDEKMTKLNAVKSTTADAPGPTEIRPPGQERPGASSVPEMREANTAAKPSMTSLPASPEPPAGSGQKVRPSLSAAARSAIHAETVKETIGLALKKSWVDRVMSGKLYESDINSALGYARDIEKETNKMDKKIWESIDQSRNRRVEQIAIRKACSGCHDRTKQFKHYWPDKFHPDLLSIYESANREAENLTWKAHPYAAE